MKNNSVPNIWTAQEKVLHLYKMVASSLGVLVFLLLIGMMALNSQNPIVVVRSEDGQEYYPSQRLRAPPEKADVEAFVKRYLANLYTWKEFSGEKIARQIAPFSDEQLVSKVLDAQNQRYVKELKGKKLAQAITFVEVEVLADRVTCRFDRVLKIEGIPLVIPTEVTLSMIQGDQTNLNPVGIYVTGITESDSGK